MIKYSYRLTSAGFWGALMFVLPTPLAGISAAVAMDSISRIGYPQHEILMSPYWYTALATITMIGFVMLLTGREVVSGE